MLRNTWGKTQHTHSSISEPWYSGKAEASLENPSQQIRRGKEKVHALQADTQHANDQTDRLKTQSQKIEAASLQNFLEQT